jgi:low molecular weight phosphotyrosine protein phosphatase
MAEAVFRSVSAPYCTSLIGNIDSSGTGAYHALDPPDYRTLSTLRDHGITDYDHSARMITKEDFRTFDFVIAMDKYNLRDLLRLRDSVIAAQSGPSARAGGKKGTRAATAAALTTCEDENTAEGSKPKIAEVRLFGDFKPDGTVRPRVGGGEEVQDPYYGGINGFEEVYEQVTRFSKGFLAYLEKQKGDSEH